MSGRSERGFIFTLDALISLTIVALLISALDYGTRPIPDYTQLETSRLANNLMEACAGHLPDESCSLTIHESCPFQHWLENVNPNMAARITYETPYFGVYEPGLELLVQDYIDNGFPEDDLPPMITRAGELREELQRIGNSSLVLQLDRPLDWSAFTRSAKGFNLTHSVLMDTILAQHLPGHHIRGFKERADEIETENDLRWLPPLEDTTDQEITVRFPDADPYQTSIQGCVRRVVSVCALNYRYITALTANDGNLTLAEAAVADDPYCRSMVCPYPVVVRLCIWNRFLVTGGD